MSDEPHKWRVAPIYWKDGMVGKLVVAYVGFDLGGGPAIDKRPCLIHRIHRIADYAGIDRIEFESRVVGEMLELAKETAEEWQRRAGTEHEFYRDFIRGQFLYVTSKPGYPMREHLKRYVELAERTWRGEP